MLDFIMSSELLGKAELYRPLCRVGLGGKDIKD